MRGEEKLVAKEEGGERRLGGGVSGRKGEKRWSGKEVGKERGKERWSGRKVGGGGKVSLK